MPQTGELEERDIRLDVQEPPSWVLQPSNLRGIEMERVEFKCQALGSDATEKEGEPLVN